jgi:hypothetical protein
LRSSLTSAHCTQVPGRAGLPKWPRHELHGPAPLRPWPRGRRAAPDERSFYKVDGSCGLVVGGADGGGIRTVIAKSEVFPVLPTSMM